MRKSVFLLLLFVFFIFNFSSCCGPCSSITDKVTEKIEEEVGEEILERIIEEASGGEVDVDTEDSVITLRGEDGEEIVMDIGDEEGNYTVISPGGDVMTSDNIDDLDIDENILYPDANDVMIVSTEDETQNMYQISAGVDNDYDAILDYYVNLRGWDIEQKIIQTDGAFLNLVSEENSNVIAHVVIGKEEDGSVGLGIVYSAKVE